MTKISTNIENNYIGRGALLNPNNRFSKETLVPLPVIQSPEWNTTDPEVNKTRFIHVLAKSMINEVKSPDIPMEYSVNPYQGCEHGCIYCYARPTHNYWGYSSGQDFESNILVKTNAVEVLQKELLAKNYVVKTICLSGNTDCYQPAERKFRITRSILELLNKWKHPVSIITKNALILRDLDLLQELNNEHLVSVAISLTSLDDDIRRALEPRASSVFTRLKTIELLVKENIPVHIMMAPIIPGINDQEIMDLVEKVSKLGVKSVSYQIVRLNGDIELMFSDWLSRFMPDRKQKILQQIRSCHGGTVNDSRFGVRMKGEGQIADIIKQQFTLATKKYIEKSERINLNHDLFEKYKPGQLRLF